LKCLAISIATAVFPTPVGPAITTTVLFFPVFAIRGIKNPIKRPGNYLAKLLTSN